MHVPMMECQPPTSLRFAMCANVRGWCMTHDFLKNNPKKRYLCDGYGSDRVFAFESATGIYMNQSFGGRSPAGLQPGANASSQPHGTALSRRHSINSRILIPPQYSGAPHQGPLASEARNISVMLTCAIPI